MTKVDKYFETSYMNKIKCYIYSNDGKSPNTLINYRDNLNIPSLFNNFENRSIVEIH